MLDHNNFFFNSAPEVVVGEPAGVAADVWGVGIIATLL